MTNLRRLPKALRIYMKDGISEGDSAIITIFLSPAEFEAYNQYIADVHILAPPMPGENEYGVDMLRRKNIVLIQVLKRPVYSAGGKVAGSETVVIRNRNVEVKWNEGVWIITFQVESLGGAFYISTSKRPVNKTDRKKNEVTIVDTNDIEKYITPSIELFALNYIGIKENTALVQVCDVEGKAIINTSIPASTRTVTLGFA
jgi:hypothetical protein